MTARIFVPLAATVAFFVGHPGAVALATGCAGLRAVSSVVVAAGEATLTDHAAADAKLATLVVAAAGAERSRAAAAASADDETRPRSGAYAARGTPVLWPGANSGRDRRPGLDGALGGPGRASA